MTASNVHILRIHSIGCDFSNGKALSSLQCRVYNHYKCAFRFTQSLGERRVGLHNHGYHHRSLETPTSLLYLRCGHFREVISITKSDPNVSVSDPIFAEMAL